MSGRERKREAPEVRRAAGRFAAGGSQGQTGAMSERLAGGVLRELGIARRLAEDGMSGFAVGWVGAPREGRA